VGLIGGVDAPEDVDRTMVFLQSSHIPEVYVIGRLQVLQMAIGAADDAVALLRNLKSKLDLAEAMIVADVRGRSDDEVRCGLDASRLPSLLLAFSTALLSYSSHSFAVLPGVLGGVLGSLKGDPVLANGED
jgi:hypothetical protein